MTWFWQGCTFMPTLALSKGKAEKGNTKNQHIIWRGLMADVLASVQWSGRGIGLWIPLVQLWMDLGDGGIFCLTDLPQLFSLSSLCSVYARHPFLPHSLFIMIFFNPTPVCRVLCFSANIEVLRTEDEYSLQECFQASIPCNSLQLRLSRGFTRSWAWQALAGSLPGLLLHIHYPLEGLDFVYLLVLQCCRSSSYRFISHWDGLSCFAWCHVHCIDLFQMSGCCVLWDTGVGQ